jgi:SAM-dependent methyltransferase
VEQVRADDLALIGRHLGRVSGPVLDLGCRPGHLTGFLRSLHNDVTGIDLVPYGPAAAGPQAGRQATALRHPGGRGLRGHTGSRPQDRLKEAEARTVGEWRRLWQRC